MQSALFGLSIGLEFVLLAGYFLYVVLRQNVAAKDRYFISFYVVIVIAFITSVLTINTILSLSRYMMSEVAFVESFLYLNFIMLAIIIIDTVRMRKSREMPTELNRTPQ